MLAPLCPAAAVETSLDGTGLRGVAHSVCAHANEKPRLAAIQHLLASIVGISPVSPACQACATAAAAAAAGARAAHAPCCLHGPKCRESRLQRLVWLALPYFHRHRVCKDLRDDDTHKGHEYHASSVVKGPGPSRLLRRALPDVPPNPSQYARIDRMSVGMHAACAWCVSL